MVKGISIFDFEHDSVCWGCTLGKNVKKSLSNNHTISKEILYLIHYDGLSPMSSPYLSGYLYYVLFINVFSGNSWIYFLKAKRETFRNF